MKISRLITLVAAVLCAGAAFAQQQQTSLGDVVRQNKPTKHATRVITDDDMPSRPQASEPPTQVSATAVASGESTDAAKPAEKDAAKDAKEAKPAEKPKDDSAEVAAMKSRVKQLDTDIEGLQRTIEGAKRGLKEIDDPERRQIIENAMKNREYSLRHAQTEREDLTKKLEDASKPKSQ
jgi:hypothetical protein